jgi:hypothetical protein
LIRCRVNHGNPQIPLTSSILSADLSATRRQIGGSSSSLSISPAGHFTIEIAQLIEFATNY